MEEIVCPTCGRQLVASESSAVCCNDHIFTMEDGVLDLMPAINGNDLQEAHHFDKVFEGGKREFNIRLDEYFGSKLVEKSRHIFRNAIEQEIPDLSKRRILIGELGCGDASAYWCLGTVPFSSVDYIGTDISMKSLQYASTKTAPINWQARFVRASVNNRIFKNDCLDIAFSTAALHHLQFEKVIDLMAHSLKNDGLLIIQEPGDRNPFAIVGRKLIKDFHTEQEKPLNPNLINRIAAKNGLRLIYEKGVNFLTGPMVHLFGMLNLPLFFKTGLFSLSTRLDRAVSHPSLSYSFIQVYKKMRSPDMFNST